MTFDVDLNCGGCEDRVTDALYDRDGVREVIADADDGRVEVTFTPHRIGDDDLRDALTDLGYTVEVVDAPAPAD